MLKRLALMFAKTCRCVLLDLKGHGNSDAPQSGYSLEELSEDLHALAQHLEIYNFTLIGLNYGANLGVELSKKCSRIQKLVLLEPPILMEEWIIKEVRKHIQDLKEMDSHTYARDLVEAVLSNGSAEDQKMAIEAFVKTPSFVQISLYEHLILWDEHFKNNKIPIEVDTLVFQSINSFTTKDKIQMHFNHAQVIQTKSHGPWLSLEIPEFLFKHLLSILSD